jgi:DNA-binding MarR family transcriptional regulator
MPSHEPANPTLRPIADLDRLIHEPSRLMILMVLYVIDSGDFLFLQGQTGLTKGNLSSHLTKLEDAGYVRVEKTFVEKMPRTVLGLTLKGRQAFAAYRQKMLDALGALPETGAI